VWMRRPVSWSVPDASYAMLHHTMKGSYSRLYPLPYTSWRLVIQNVDESITDIFAVADDVAKELAKRFCEASLIALAGPDLHHLQN
jgi:hypothetical protein